MVHVADGSKSYLGHLIFKASSPRLGVFTPHLKYVIGGCDTTFLGEG